MNLRILTLLGGTMIVAMGISAYFQDPASGGSVLNAGLSLGGIFIICGLFAIKSPQHGRYAAVVVALVGFAGNIPAVWAFLTSATSTALPVPEIPARAGFAGVSLILLIATIRTLAKERRLARQQELKSE